MLFILAEQKRRQRKGGNASPPEVVEERLRSQTPDLPQLFAPPPPGKGAKRLASRHSTSGSRLGGGCAPVGKFMFLAVVVRFDEMDEMVI